MPDLLKEHIKAILQEEIRKTYPHLLKPVCMYAQIKELLPNHMCTLQVLTEKRQVDSTFPPIPYVPYDSDKKMEVGDIAIICFLYGSTIPYILGKER